MLRPTLYNRVVQKSAMNITMFTTKNENIGPYSEGVFPFVVSLSNHERGRYGHSPFDKPVLSLPKDYKGERQKGYFRDNEDTGH